MTYRKPLGAGLAMLLVSAIAMAQAPKTTNRNSDSAKKSAASKGDQTKPATQAPNPFQDLGNDPVMKLQRLRMMIGVSGGGGRGGRGGPGGGMDGGPVGFLLASKPLQDELKLSDKQKRQLATLTKQRDEERQQAFQGMGRNNQGLDPQERRALFAAARERMDAMQQQTEEAVGQILTATQQKRLGQVMLQIEGPLAVAKPDVAEQIGMTEDQLDLVQEVIDAMQAAEREQRQQMFGRGGPGGPRGGGPPGGGPPGGGPPAAGAPPQDAQAPAGKARTKADANAQPQTDANGNTVAQPNGGAARRRTPPDPEQMKKMAEGMKKAADQSEEFRTEAIARISKILTKPQKSAFNKLLGKPIPVADLAKLLPEGGPPGRGPGMFGRPPQNAPAQDAAPKGARSAGKAPPKNADSGQ